ncbi:MAG: glutamate--cysteine ligase [Xenococcaceae cyanobacterium]
MLLSKGFEIEMYTGTPQGDVVGLADRIVRDLDGFVREPDSRNVEYTTAPFCCYDRLLCAILKPRRTLRNYLRQLGNHTIIPGSTLSLGDSQRFWRSDPNNPYHDYIEQTYGTKVVTASIHINVGISDPEKLMQACRLLRVEAPLYLALSASSPFLDGQATGFHSARWGMFPKTPAEVPLFASHAHFIDWTEAQLAKGTMQNVRHLWSSVRPNGDRRPYNLNRLELRISDLVVNPIHLLAITAFLETRLLQMLENESLDPLKASKLKEEELLALCENNERAAAISSLNARLHHWQDGREILASDWIEEIYREVLPIATKNGITCFLSPLKKLLREGNMAMQWMELFEAGLDIRSILQQEMQKMEQQERELEEKVCQPALVA